MSDTENTSRFSRDTNRVTEDDILSQNSSSTYRYPEELATEEFPSWVTFYPLVRKGAITATGGSFSAFSGANREFDQSGQMRMDPANTTAALAAGGVEQAATAAIGSIGASGLKDILTNSGGKGIGGKITGALTGLAKATGQVVGTAAAGGAAGAGLALLVNEDNKLMFGAKSVSLGIHNSISQRYSSNWDTADIGAIMGAVGTGQANISGVMDFFSEAGDVGQYALRKVGASLGGPKMKAAMEAGTKKVENPYKEQLFKNMDFRTFDFEYRFMPKNLAEARAIFGDGTEPGIIKTFIQHMHPTSSDHGLFLVYPSEFLIMFFYNGKENKKLRKISNCALNSIDIQYGGEGLVYFQGSEGYPSECTIKLKFTELETLTSQRIEAGF